MRKITIPTTLIMAVLSLALAQTAHSNSGALSNKDMQTIKEVDSLLEQKTTVEVESNTQEVNKAISRKSIKKLNVTDHSKMLPESEYSKYSVVQDSQTLKLEKFQLKAGLSMLQNDPLYSSYGFSLNLLYNFNETFAVGLGGTALSSEASAQYRNITNIQSTNLDAVPTLKSSVGVSLYITPIYGKWSFANQSIFQYETYLSLGAAQVADQFSKTSPASSLSLGHVVYISPKSAIEAQLQGLFYSTQNINAQDKSANSVLLTFGYSLLWPSSDM